MPRTPNFKFNRTLPEMVGDIRRPRPMAETGWHAIGRSVPEGVVFQNGVAADTARPPAWMTGEDGFVRCKGVIKPPDSPTFPFVAWTFPEEARPVHAEPFLLGIVGGGYCNGYVDTNGDVVIEAITYP